MTSHAHPIAMPPSYLCWSAFLLACSAGAEQEPGSRSFERQLALEDSAATSANVSIGDVNADGHQDIVLVKGRHWPLQNLVLLGDGSGSFQPAYPVGQPDRSYSGVLVDMDRDGDLDLVVSNDNPDAKLVHLNDGNGRFTTGSTYGQPEWSTRHVTVADLNDDSLPDVVLANRSGGDSGVSYICFGSEGGRFETECVGFARGSATTITAADFNHDGAVDLAVPHRDGGQSFIYLNDGKGGFEERRPFGPPTAAIRSARAADLDGDGRFDLVVIDERSGPGIVWGRRDGTYAPVERLGASRATPYSVAVADLDRNGRMDVIVGFVESRPVVYFNDGPGTFVPVPFGDAEGVAYGFAVGDLDEDGWLDIAMARSGAKNMVYFGSSLPAEKLETIAASTGATRCFALPGSGSGATKSYRVVAGGGLEEAGEVSGGAMHVRAAFHPDGRTLYVSSVGPAGWEPWDGRSTWEEGIHVRAYVYDPTDCSIGGLLGTGRMGSDAPVIERAYGLLVDPTGRYLYQTTNSLQWIRLFDLPEDRVPVPRAEFDVTAGGEHVCVQIRRLSMHPSRPYLYANCNNGDGEEDALQVWAIERDGAIGLIDHYTFPAMNGGVLDPVVHPSGDWLYQPVGTDSADAPAGIGAYVLIYRVGVRGMLTLHHRLPVRTIPADSLVESTHVSNLPMNILLHPDGGTAYVPVHSQVVQLDSTGYAVSDTGSEAFRHGFAIYTIEDGGARLVERAWLPALRETVFSTHHGATLAAYGGELFLYSYLTDYDTIQGGVLQRLRITEDYSLEPLDPAWLPTGLFDGRQPIAMPGNGRAVEARSDTSGTG